MKLKGITEMNCKLSKYQCCADFEELDEMCVSCMIGYSSYIGQPCLPCNDGYYGKNCLKECECTIGCHHVSGCIEANTTTDIISELTQTTQSTVSESTNDDKYIDRTESTQTTVKVPESSDEKTEIDNIGDDMTVSPKIENGNILYDWKIYMGSVAFLVLILWIGSTCYMCKTRHRNTIQITPNLNQEESTGLGEMRVESEDNENGIYEFNGAEYHFIDESQMVDMSAEANVYLEVIDKSSSSTSTGSPLDNAEGYLNPYDGLVPSEDYHTYEGDNRERNDQVETDSYLTPTFSDTLNGRVTSETSSEQLVFRNDESDGSHSNLSEVNSYLDIINKSVSSKTSDNDETQLEIQIPDTKKDNEKNYITPVYSE